MNRGLLHAAVPLVLAALAALACATNPVTQQREVVFVSEQQEAEAGEAAAAQVEAEMGIVDDSRLTGYVARVGRRVAQAAPQRQLDYRFLVVDLQEPNAFALPGGYVYVSRGLLALTNDEDELANVIAHEVIHVAGRHHAQRHARATGVGLLALPGLLAGALIGGPVGDLVSAPVAVAGAGALAGYSRDQELEADEYGQQIAARAGYDPRGLPRFLVQLEREMQLEQEAPREPSWLDTHPTNPRRVAEGERRAAGIALAPRPPVAGGRPGFLSRLDGVLVGENPAEGVFRGQRFLHPDLGFTVVFPADWRTVNSRSAVGAIHPRGEAQIAIQSQGRGGDPREAASAFLQELSQQTRVDVARLEPLRINGLEAVRGQMVAAARRGTVTLDLTWISHRGGIYRIAGVVPRGYSDAHRATFGRVVESFRELAPEERRGIREARLRVRPALAGETLEGFVRRTGSVWSPAQVAVANGLPSDAALAAGQLLKVALPQPYGS